VKTRKRRDSIMKLKLGERDATLYYEEIDYSAYQDLVFLILRKWHIII
jgi:hypothetical protein